jgi:outer membrane protein
LPSVSISTSYGESSLNYGEANEIKLEPKVSKIEARQILFAGGRLVNNRLQSINTVKAGRANLRIVEQDILFTAADAFFGVLKSKKIIELMESNFQILTERLVVTKIQFDVGELTLTDVAQSEARLALAQADLLEARAKLKISNANYKAIIGNEPNNLLEYKKNIKLPDTVDDAILIAERNSPLLHFAEKTEKSSKYGLASARSMLSPVVSIQGEFSNSKEVFMRDYNGDSYQITGSVSMPLFAGGLNWSNIRKAQELNNKDRYFLVESKRLIKKEIKTAFAEYESSLSRIISTQKQVDANEIALEGVKIEFELGTRTNLDVLDAERERLDSQVSLINAKNDSMLSRFFLLLNIGELTPEKLSLPINSYDPERNYNKVRNIKIGWKSFKDIKNVD